MRYDYSMELQKIESVLQKNLPDAPGAGWNENIFGTLPGCVTEKHIEQLSSPCAALLKLGGKRWRPLLLTLCAAAAAGTEESPEAAYEITPLVEFVHTASLIHDDIEDCADTRRGMPAAHITWGIDTAINAGSWLYFTAAACLTNVPLPAERKLALYRLYAEELRRLHLGQAMDIAWHKDNTALPSVQEYEAMVRMKTGTLAALAAKAGTLVGGGTAEQESVMGNAAADIGVGFQILDDVLNLTTGNIGKKRGDDIVEGKKSLPVLIHLAEQPQDFDTVMACFTQARKDGIESPAVERCVTMLTASGAVAAAHTRARTLIRQACAKVTGLYPDSAAARKIDALFTSMLP